MSRCHEIQPQLSAYADGTVDLRIRAEVHAHLAGCATCSAVLLDIQQLVAVARELGPMTPPDRIWTSLARQLPPATNLPAAQGPIRQRRDLWAWVGVPAALMAAMLILYVNTGRAPAAPAAGPGRAAAAVETAASELDLAVHHYERAIAELETVSTAEPDEIDPAVVTALRESLATLDVAINESRQALAFDPENEPARASLFEALQRKIGVLQATALLQNGMR
jgi:hypothetical protein